MKLVTRKKMLAPALLAALLLGILPAFAAPGDWVRVAGWDRPEFVVPYMADTSPDAGRWANIFFRDGPPGQRRLQWTDLYQFYWDSSQIEYFRSQNQDPAIVFHHFQQDTNCAGTQPWNFNNYWWIGGGPINVSGQVKWADCNFLTSSSHNNELRGYFPRWELIPGRWYEVGAEFIDYPTQTLGNWGSGPGQVTFDTYFGSTKAFMGKNCFWYWYEIYEPFPSGRCSG